MIFASTMLFGLGFGLSNTHQAVETKAADTLYTTCDFTTKVTGSTSYTTAWTYDSNWNVFGGANNNKGWAYMKFCGKNTYVTTANPAYVNNITAFDSSISKINVSLLVGTLSLSGTSITSWGVKVYSDATLTTLIDDSSLTTLAKPTVAVSYDFVPSDTYKNANSTLSWATGSFYKVYFTYASTSSSNGVVWVDKVSFYKEAAFVSATSVSITDPTSSSLTVGTPVSLTATVLPETTTDKTITWTSSSDYIAKVLSNGQVIPCNDGTVTITATSVSNSSLSDSYEFTVTGQDTTSLGHKITATSLGLLGTYVNGYYGTGIVYNIRGVMKNSTNSQLQFGNNATAGQGLIYNVTSFGTEIDTIVVNTGATGASVASVLYIGTAANPSITTVTPTVSGTVATYDVGSIGDFMFFAFGITGTTGTNYYDSIAINLINTPTDYAQNFLSATSTECAALSVTTDTWATLQTGFEALSSTDKAAIVGASADVVGIDIQRAVARYTYIVSKYGYTDFLGIVSVASPVTSATSDSNEYNIAALVIGLIGVSSIGAYYFLTKKRRKIEN